MQHFQFLHTADWHLGRTFATSFEASVGAQLQRARLSALKTLLETARARGIRHVLVAGDTFHDKKVGSDVQRAALAILGSDAGIRWHFIAGNHDWLETPGVWRDLMGEGLPANVTMYAESVPVELEPGVWLLPSSLQQSAMTQDPLAWMVDAATPEGALRLGLAHGSFDIGGGLDVATPISADALKHARLDYLALGDWHGTKQVAAQAWYSGTPEPDGFKANDAGNALVVTVQSGAPPLVERVSTAQHVWINEMFDGDPEGGLGRVWARINAMPPRSHAPLVRVQVSGPATLHEITAYQAGLEAIRLQALTVRERGEFTPEIDPNAIEFARLADAAAFKPIIETLRVELQSEDAKTVAVARAALQALSVAATDSKAAAPGGHG